MGFGVLLFPQLSLPHLFLEEFPYWDDMGCFDFLVDTSTLRQVFQ
jgi:hypothetical protein